jgi:hypothetical protein
VPDPAIYREATARHDWHFTISFIDCGSTIDAPVTQEVLRDLDALISVSSPWVEARRRQGSGCNTCYSPNPTGARKAVLAAHTREPKHCQQSPEAEMSAISRRNTHHGVPRQDRSCDLGIPNP